MSNERDTLARLIDDSVLTHTGRSVGDRASERVSDDILSAGYVRVSEDDETVEKLAKALYAHVSERLRPAFVGLSSWEDTSESARNLTRGDARAALRALRKDTNG